ncbi:MAG: C4-type zinc ribbon domain-containing protein [Actinomycetota bacterium]
MTAHDFLQLQAVDSALDALANRRPRLPELAVHDRDKSAVAAVESAMAVAQARVDAAQKAIEAAEHAANDLTAKRVRLEAQLKTVIAPREAEALMNQIATINGQRGELDDQELAALDEQAAAEAEIAVLGQQLPALHAALEVSGTMLTEAVATLDAEAATLHAERVGLVATMAAGDLATYAHARKQFHGVGVAHLEGSHCSGCHMDLSPAELDLVKSSPVGALSECPQCGRILVR